MAPLVALLLLLGADAAWASTFALGASTFALRATADKSADRQRIPGQSPRPSSLQGVVRDPDERPVPGAQVELRQRAASGRPVAFGATRATTTSADGVFRFLDVPAGDYTITVTHPQYQPFTSEGLRVGASELLTTTVALAPVAPAAPVAPVAPDAPDAPDAPVAPVAPAALDAPAFAIQYSRTRS